MRKKKMKLPIWMIAAVFLFIFAFQAAGPAYAGGSVSVVPPELEVTGYTVFKGNAVYTGPVNRGDVITIRISFLDARIKSPPPPPPPPPDPAPVYPTITPPLVPIAAPNTSAFTVPGNGKLSAGPSVDANGCYFTFDFVNLEYKGTGEPFNVFSCSISYTGLSPQLAVASVSLTLNQLNQYIPPPPPDPQPPPEPPEPPVLIPTSFILKDARYGDGVVYAGEQFLLSLVLMATNGSNAVDNVAVSFSPPEQLTLADGASVSYLGTMRPGTSTTANVALLASANIPEGSYTVSIDVNGVNPQTGELVVGHMTVTIPVLQPERFEIFEARLPTDLTAGMDDGMGFSTVTLVNKGRGTVGNVMIEVVGDGLYAEEGRQYLGNVAGGEQKMADFILHADTPGKISAYVYVTYENVRGEQKVLEWPFTVNVNEAWIEDPGWDEGFFPPEEDPVSAGPPMWVWLIIIAAAAIVGSVLLVRRHRKKKEAAEAALDEDDDDDEDI